MGLPVGFLPFDPSCDNKDSDDEEDEELSPETDEESNEDTLKDPVVNGENNHQQKSARHIGGGVLLGSASECILVAMLAARTKKITSKRLADPLIEDGQILARLVCYTSKLV